MTDRARDPYFDLPGPAEREGPDESGRPVPDEPQRGPGERIIDDPAGRRVPFVDGPTGAAPLASELRGDPDADEPGTRRDERR